MISKTNRVSGYQGIWKLGGILFLVVSLLSIVSFTVGCTSSKETPLETVKVTRGNILAQLPTTGVVIPRNRLEIKPPVAGRVEEVLVVEGQWVRKGKVLARMSSTERATLLDAARAKGGDELKYWEDVYKAAPIMAPISGVIIKRSMEPGQNFSVSDAVLVMSDQLIVQAQVDETDIGRIKVGQKASIALDAYADQLIDGYVEQIAYESVTVNNVTVYYVDVRPYSVPEFFRSGMSATVNFKLSEKNNVLILPQKAVKQKGKMTYVFVKTNSEIKAMQIQAGMESEESIEVVAGLKDGDEVVIPSAKIIQDTIGNNRHQPFNIFGSKKK
ncbi:MAG: HlyD family efflux transporter periplasmic adaptor subunit [Candidatus Margulisiibacteriota bacterium]